jgi:hypothetical protein
MVVIDTEWTDIQTEEEYMILEIYFSLNIDESKRINDT